MSLWNLFLMIFLALNNGIVSDILRKIKANQLLSSLEDKWQGKTVSKEDFVMALTKAKNQLNNCIEKLQHIILNQICLLL